MDIKRRGVLINIELSPDVVMIATGAVSVMIVEMRGEAAADCNCFHKTAIKLELDKYTTVLTNTRAEWIDSHGLYGIGGDEKELFVEADTVICAAGMRYDHRLWEELSELDGIEIYTIGDAVKPAKVTQAVFDGYYRAEYL